MSESINVHVHNNGSGTRWMNVIVTLAITGGLTALAYQLSISGFAEMAASGISMFLVTLIGYMFKAGILRLPEKSAEEDDLAFTKSTLRRIYDEIQMSIARSSLLKLVLFALGYTLGWLVLRAAIAFGLGLLNAMWVAIGVGLIVGGLVIAQDQILAWVRTRMVRKGDR